MAIAGLLMISSIGAFAQMSFGAKAGLNLTNMTIKAGDEKNDDISYKYGFNAGAFADFSISDLFGVEAGLNVEMKGYQINNEYDGSLGITSETIKENLTYVTIPVDVKLSFGSFYVLAGPYFGIAAIGKIKVKKEFKNTDDYKHTEDIKFGNKKGESDLKRMDLGVGFGAGYEINNHLGIRLGYDLGLANLQPGGDSKNSTKNGSINISATYKF